MNARGPLTLPGALRFFFSNASPVLLLLVAAGALAFRVYLGGFTWIDLAVCAGLVVFYPFQEWLIHVFILHQRPRKIFGFTFQFLLSKQHHRHHEMPWDLSIVFIPWPTHVVALPLIVLGVYFADEAVRPYVLTGVATLWVHGLVYEWVHFVSHAPYRARTRWLRELQRLHRLHHFKSEQHWFGVATNVADRVLGTAPDPDSIDLSPTCRTLEKV